MATTHSVVIGRSMAIRFRGANGEDGHVSLLLKCGWGELVQCG